MEAEVGFSVENILASFGGVDVLLEHLKSGRIRGVVNLVGCNNPKVVYEEAVVKVADELIAHDVLPLTNGCAAYALLKLGFCLPEGLAAAGPGLNEALKPHRMPPVWHMGECLDNARASAFFRAISDASGEPLKRLPLAFSSPEWSNEKGLGAAMGFRLLGPPVAGSDKVAKFFYEDTRELLGAVMVVDPDPLALARRIIADFDARRTVIGWQECAAPATKRLSVLQKEKELAHTHRHDNPPNHHHDPEERPHE
jgi:carbon-monoxide dehydrogenase catalytic subunit